MLVVSEVSVEWSPLVPHSIDQIERLDPLVASLLPTTSHSHHTDCLSYTFYSFRLPSFIFNF